MKKKSARRRLPTPRPALPDGKGWHLDDTVIIYGIRHEFQDNYGQPKVRYSGKRFNADDLSADARVETVDLLNNAGLPPQPKCRADYASWPKSWNRFLLWVEPSEAHPVDAGQAAS